jgi:hypothetical protein
MLCRVIGLLVFAVILLPAPLLQAAEPIGEQDLAARIDHWLAVRWKAAQVEPSPAAEDAEFLRRIYLDLAGRIPSLVEARTFLADNSPDKRRRLVHELLETPAHLEHFVNVWRDRLLPEVRTSDDLQGQVGGFNDWLRKQINQNVPYDVMVREILTIPFGRERVRTRKPQVEPTETPAPTPLAFYVAKEAKPENLAASTAKLFLGVRIECAQCHDHPSGSWSRLHFWGYAAFFAGLQRTSPEAGGAIREVFDRRDLRIPGSVQTAEARFLDDTPPRWRYNVGARTTLAEWLTAPGNPYFARAAVNRLWAQLFGVGLVEPVDDFRADNPPSHPELLDELAGQFVAHHFDWRFLIRALTASRAYQLTSAAASSSPGNANSRLFTHMALKGLTPEQLFDSLALATGYQAPVRRDPNTRQPQPDQSARTEFLARFAIVGQAPTEAERSIQQALMLMNGPFIADATQLKAASLQKVVGDATLDTSGQIESLFLLTLSRKPTGAEARRFTDYVRGGGPHKEARRALADVFWVLLNSAEFSLNH